MSTLTSSIQHSIRSPSDSTQTRKTNKRYPNWKERDKIVIISNDMILYVENPKDSTQKLLGLINDRIQQGSRIQDEYT